MNCKHEDRMSQSALYFSCLFSTYHVKLDLDELKVNGDEYIDGKSVDTFFLVSIQLSEGCSLMRWGNFGICEVIDFLIWLVVSIIYFC